MSLLILGGNFWEFSQKKCWRESQLLHWQNSTPEIQDIKFIILGSLLFIRQRVFNTVFKTTKYWKSSFQKQYFSWNLSCTEFKYKTNMLIGWDNQAFPILSFLWFIISTVAFHYYSYKDCLIYYWWWSMHFNWMEK